MWLICFGSFLVVFLIVLEKAQENWFVVGTGRFWIVRSLFSSNSGNSADWTEQSPILRWQRKLWINFWGGRSFFLLLSFSFRASLLLKKHAQINYRILVITWACFLKKRMIVSFINWVIVFVFIGDVRLFWATCWVSANNSKNFTASQQTTFVALDLVQPGKQPQKSVNL